MNSELFVLTFSEEEDTQKTLQALETMGKNWAFGLNNAVLVKRDESGRALVHQYTRYPSWRPVSDNKFLLSFTEAVFRDTQKDAIRPLVDAGLDECFLEEVASTLQPGGSALMVYIPDDSLVDTRLLLETLATFRGTVHQTIFPVQVERTILEQEITKKRGFAGK
jgi:uncharacterized membrane protein